MSHHSRKVTINEEKQPPAEASAAATPAEVDIAALEERVRTAEDAALRATAELQNLKRRQREEMELMQDTATKSLVLALLPVIDDFDRALAAAGTSTNSDSLRDGVNLTVSKLMNALRTVGVQKMLSIGEPFDPAFHEAVMQMEPSEEFPAGTIAQELRSGYTQHGHVIRPSLVAVAHE